MMRSVTRTTQVDVRDVPCLALQIGISWVRNEKVKPYEPGSDDRKNLKKEVEALTRAETRCPVSSTERKFTRVMWRHKSCLQSMDTCYVIITLLMRP